MFWFRYVPAPPTTDRSIRPQTLDVCREVPEHKKGIEDYNEMYFRLETQSEYILEIMK